MAHLGTREADDSKLGGQQPLLSEAVQSGNQLSLGQVTRRAEDYDGARLSGALEPDALSQWIITRASGHFLFPYKFWI